jgi:hypothetical protein
LKIKSASSNNHVPTPAIVKINSSCIETVGGKSPTRWQANIGSGGLLIITGTLLLPFLAAAIFFFATTTVMVVVPLVKSWQVFKEEKRKTAI